MTRFSATKRIFVALMVLFTFLSIKQVIASDSHDIGNLPLKACPVCAASETQSFTEHSFTDVSVKTCSDIVYVLLPVAEFSLLSSISLTLHNNRAPPQIIAA